MYNIYTLSYVIRYVERQQHKDTKRMSEFIDIMSNNELILICQNKAQIHKKTYIYTKRIIEKKMQGQREKKTERLTNSQENVDEN